MVYNRNDCTIQNGGMNHVSFKWCHFIIGVGALDV